MKVLADETVVRFHVEFSDEETDILQTLGRFPPDAPRPPRLWLTGEEIALTQSLLDSFRELVEAHGPDAARELVSRGPAHEQDV